MKRLKISRLMDEYTDTEFFPAGGSVVDPEVITERVLAQATPAKRRGVPPTKMILLAAALAAGCLLSVAAGLPMRAYRLVTGDPMVVQTDRAGWYHTYISLENGAPVILEDGRLRLELPNGERTDITDFIDADTPYIVEGEDRETGLKNYLVVGGTPEDYGLVIYQEMPSGGYNYTGWNNCTVCCLIEGKLVEYDDWLASNSLVIGDPIPSELIPELTYVNKPWQLNAEVQLGIIRN